MPSSRTHCSGRPIALNTSSQPLTAAARLAGSVTSPGTSSTPDGTSRPARDGSRTSARTSSPRASRARAVAPPTFPVAPVTSARTRGSYAAAHERLHRLRRVSRFSSPQDPLFRAMNSSVAFDYRLAPYDPAQAVAHALTAKELIRDLMSTLLELAERHVDWAMPGYTHLQRAQPVYLSHHLLAYFWKLRRDVERFDAAMAGAGDLPLGAGALAGVNFETDRESVATELAFRGIAQNSIDAVSNRDFVLDYLAAAATCATHLSSLGAEIVLWSSDEFGFCELSDSFASVSSIMPQKKNPDAAELLRAKAPRIVAHLSALHGVLHGLPLTYNKDLQEDKEHLFDAVDTLELSLRAAREMLRGITYHRGRMAEAAADELLAATDVADLLVRRGVPFREAHGIVAGLGPR